MNCPYFGKCGGCTNKKVDLSNIERRLGVKIKFFSGKDTNYRTRMDFSFHKNGLGLRNNWRTIIDIKECIISNKRINELLKEVRKNFPKPIDSLKYCVIRTPKESSITFIISDEKPVEQIKKYADISTADDIIIGKIKKNSDNSVSNDIKVIKGSRFLKTIFLDKEFKFDSQGFFQNNNEIAEKMLSYVNKLLKKYPTKGELIDLYGGAGVFGIINAGLFDKTKILEIDEGNVQAAKENIKINNLKNKVEAIKIDAKYLKKISFDKPLYMITDPPRTGMSIKTIKEINLLQPEVIIYISCNPNQLIKEISFFKNYKIKSASLFDMFPRTEHSELVVELIKK